TLGISGGGAAVTLMANGADGGDGGQISVTALGSGLSIANANNSFMISAQGGAVGGTGGTVNLSALNDINVVQGPLLSQALNVSSNGGGGAIIMSAGVAQSGNPSLGGNIFVTGDLNASAGGAGNAKGGSINLLAPGIVYVSGQLAANGTG